MEVSVRMTTEDVVRRTLTQVLLNDFVLLDLKVECEREQKLGDGTGFQLNNWMNIHSTY